MWSFVCADLKRKRAPGTRLIVNSVIDNKREQISAREFAQLSRNHEKYDQRPVIFVLLNFHQPKCVVGFGKHLFNFVSSVVSSVAYFYHVMLIRNQLYIRIA